MKHLSSSITLLILSLLVILGGAGLWYGYGNLMAMKDHETDMKQQIAEEESRSERLSALKNAFGKTAEEKQELSEYFYLTTEDDWLRFATDMETLTRAAGVDAKSSIGGFSPNGGVFTDEIKFSGTWDQSYRMHRMLESFPARLIIRSFSLQTDTGSSQTPSSKWQGIVSIELKSTKKP